MEINSILNDKTKLTAVAIAVVVILLPLGYSVVNTLFSQTSEDPFLEMPDPTKYKACVKETEYMRYHHMHLLKDVRDEVMREGKRGHKGLNDEAITISGCGKCHTSKERFCDRCHNAVNLRLDCYTCHDYPGSNTEVHN